MSGIGITTPYMVAAEALYERMQTVYGSAGIALYENVVPVPPVTMGTPLNVKAFHVWVDMLPYNSSTSGSASNHEAASAFSLNVYLVAKHSDRNECVRILQTYINSSIYGILADATLGGRVGNCIPRIEDVGIDQDQNKQYIAAAAIEVSVKTFSMCPQEFRALVEGGNGGA